MALLKRNEVPAELCWDLAYLFATTQDYEQSLAEAERKTAAFVRCYLGKIATCNDTRFLAEAIQAYEEILIILDRCGNYASLAVTVDYGNQENGERELRFGNTAAELGAQLSFFDSEIKQVSAELLEALIVEQPAYQAYLEKLIEEIPHTLVPESEKLLAEFAPIFNLPENAYQQSKLADMQFDSFLVDGKEYPMSFVLYENEYCHSTNTSVRRAAFASFSKGLRAYENTIGTLYSARVQAEKTESKLRGYSSVIEMLLAKQQVSGELYNRQIDLIMTELAPHMRRFAKLLQRYYQLEEMRYSDLKVILDPLYSPKTDIPSAKEHIKAALSVLGSEYSSLIERALHERRIDYAMNEGKSTGGFCATPYQKGCFILLNWAGELSEVFTLAHELGHLAHFDLAQQDQRFLNSECSLYLVEAPSTCNELLLSDYFLQLKSDDARFRRWVLASMVANTYYHNFVTHLLEAAYQREVYRAVDAGEALQADDFSAIFNDVLRQFWGDSVVLDEGAELTWMRQPHYYSGLYPYTYSAGLTISTAVSRRIATEGQNAVDDWLACLSAGGSLRPLEFAKRAGVSIDTDAALRETIAYIGSMIEQIEGLLPADENYALHLAAEEIK